MTPDIDWAVTWQQTLWMFVVGLIAGIRIGWWAHKASAIRYAKAKGKAEWEAKERLAGVRKGLEL